MKAISAARWAALAALAIIGSTGPARADDGARAYEARGAILELDLPKAHALLDDRVSSDPEISLERGRLALYEGDYDHAAAILSKPELAHSEAGAELLAVAEGCARATAGAVIEVDAARGVSIRFQDESDAPLAPFLADVVASARESLLRDLKVDLPRPLRIELVRDLFTLAAMTGLPESAAQKTGTVAVAKWGRVTMISPRAIPRGYPWADTLAHEMAHLAQTRASRDRAPLWLQEGVAKRQEARWRPGRPLDDFPAADTVAAVGLDKGLGRPIDKLGGSIALLPTAEEAMVAFAEVSSFVRFWIQTTNDDALPALLVQLRTAEGDDYVDKAMKAVTGNSLPEWNVRWLTYLGGVRRELPRGVRLGESHPRASDIHRGLHLGSLLLGRAHPDAAKQALEPAQKLAPFDPLLRHHLAQALFALGQKSEAEKLISRMEDLHSEFGPWMALHGRWLLEQGETERGAAAFETGLLLCPLSPEVACEAKSPPDMPPSPTKAPLCQAARSALQD
jgi:tetratricopeptide (TPR) repeat protein